MLQLGGGRQVLSVEFYEQDGNRRAIKRSNCLTTRTIVTKNLRRHKIVTSKRIREIVIWSPVEFQKAQTAIRIWTVFAAKHVTWHNNEPQAQGQPPNKVALCQGREDLSQSGEPET